MKTSMFLAAIAAVGIAAPSASAQPRTRDHRQPAAEAAPTPRQNERVPAQADRKDRDERRRDHRDDDRRRDRRDGDHRQDGDRRERGDRERGDRRDGDRPGYRGETQLVVSSYWPHKGKASTLVTIRGENFAQGTKVMLGNDPIQPKQVTPTQITFRIPKTASGTQPVRLQVPNSRRLFVVGGFEVSNFDAAAERRRLEAERKREAQERWEKRRKDLAKTEKDRRDRLARREAELRESRQQRRQERVADVRARFQAAFLADPQTRAEMALHAERMARLQRMMRVAEANDDGKRVVRIEVALAKETQRHENRMATLQSSFSID